MAAEWRCGGPGQGTRVLARLSTRDENISRSSAGDRTQFCSIRARRISSSVQGDTNPSGLARALISHYKAVAGELAHVCTYTCPTRLYSDTTHESDGGTPGPRSHRRSCSDIHSWTGRVDTSPIGETVVAWTNSTSRWARTRRRDVSKVGAHCVSGRRRDVSKVTRTGRYPCSLGCRHKLWDPETYRR